MNFLLLIVCLFITTTLADNPSVEQRLAELERKLKLEEQQLSTLLQNGRKHTRQLTRALRNAVINGDKNSVTLVLDLGADVNSKFRFPFSLKGRTALHIAAEKGFTDIVDILFKHGATIGITDLMGSTPLHYAAWNGKLNTVSQLIKYGADVNSKNNDGRTPYDDAVSQEHQDVVTELQKYLKSPAVSPDVPHLIQGPILYQHGARIYPKNTGDKLKRPILTPKVSVDAQNVPITNPNIVKQSKDLNLEDILDEEISLDTLQTPIKRTGYYT